MKMYTNHCYFKWIVISIIAVAIITEDFEIYVIKNLKGFYLN